MNSAANTDYPCRKATCCGEDDPFPNFTQDLIPYRMMEAKQCVSNFTPSIPPPAVTPEFDISCPNCPRECITTLITETDECGNEFTSESYLCSVKKSDECCKGPAAVSACNDEQTCCVTCPDGTVSCYTLEAGLVCAATKALANAQAYSVACIRAEEYKICILSYTLCCCVGDAFSFTFDVRGGGSTKTMIISDGALPPGLTLDGFTISGTPTISGNFVFEVQVTDGRSIATKACMIYSMEITTASITPAVVGTPYSFQMQVAGGSGSYGWVISSGALPAGLSMDLSGLITGTPTASGSSSIVFEVVDLTCTTPDPDLVPVDPTPSIPPPLDSHALFIPAITLTGVSTTYKVALLGFEPYVRNDQDIIDGVFRRYKKLAYTGTSHQWATTLGGVWCAGARYVWSGATEIDVTGRVLTRYRKDYYSACPNPVTIPLIDASSATYAIRIEDGGWPISDLKGYCYPSDPNSCATCTADPYVFVRNIISSREGTDRYDNTDFLHSSGLESFTELTRTFIETIDRVVLLKHVTIPVTTYKGVSGRWVHVYAEHNYSSVLSNEYTYAEALANATTTTGTGLVAENLPTATNVEARYTSVQFTLTCSNLIIGEHYKVSVDFRDRNMGGPTQTYDFTATAVTHVITGAIPTPASENWYEATNPQIDFA